MLLREWAAWLIERAKASARPMIISAATLLLPILLYRKIYLWWGEDVFWPPVVILLTIFAVSAVAALTNTWRGVSGKASAPLEPEREDEPEPRHVKPTRDNAPFSMAQLRRETDAARIAQPMWQGGRYVCLTRVEGAYYMKNRDSVLAALNENDRAEIIPDAEAYTVEYGSTRLGRLPEGIELPKAQLFARICKVYTAAKTCIIAIEIYQKETL